MDLLLKTEGLKKYYGSRPVVRAVDNVSLSIQKGRSLALIGESGSGKTTFGKLVCGLEKVTDGKIVFQGREMQKLPEKEFRPYRRDLQMIFQSSGGVFDPAYTIGESIKEILKNYEKLSNGEYEDRVDEALEKVGLSASLKNRYVGQISGGQCQRANIARALALYPKLVICDEPVSSLDYSIRKNILNLLNEIQEKNDVTYLLITHDLSNVPYVCQTVAIMYQGQIMEYLDHTDRIGEEVVHPYSQLLFRSIPVADPHKRTIGAETNQAEAAMEPVERGCPFRKRCIHCMEICKEQTPSLREGQPGHLVACHYIHK